MGIHDAFGCACRAAGIANLGRIVPFPRYGRLELSAVGNQIAEWEALQRRVRSVHCDCVFDRSQLGTKLEERIGLTHDRSGLAVPDDVAYFGYR